MLSRALAKRLLPMATTLRTLQPLSNMHINVPAVPSGFQALCYHKSWLWPPFLDNQSRDLQKIGKYSFFWVSKSVFFPCLIGWGNSTSALVLTENMCWEFQSSGCSLVILVIWCGTGNISAYSVFSVTLTSPFLLKKKKKTTESDHRDWNYEQSDKSQRWGRKVIKTQPNVKLSLTFQFIKISVQSDILISIQLLLNLSPN